MARKFVLKNIRFRLISILIFAICLLIVWNWNSTDKTIPTRYLVSLQPEPETIFQDRNMSIYDSGGQVDICFNNFVHPLKECKNLQKGAREFIYKHWQEKRRAYIILEFDGEGGGEYNVFIEPNKNGNWHIVWRSKYSNFERGFSSNILDEQMTSVKYKTATDTEDDYPFEVGTKYLIFFDKTGKVSAIL
ncbi:MAG: hypothetical protein ABI891_08200 [Acidobacteriota bacterium]